MVGTTRLQNGHWKSENTTMFTFASAGPFDAPSSGTRTRSTPSPMPMAFLLSAADGFATDAVAVLPPPPSLPRVPAPEAVSRLRARPSR